MPKRHRADCSTLDDFADEVLVVCPGCGGRALVRRLPLDPPVKAGMAIARFEGRLTCASCGRSARAPAFVQTIHAPRDPILGLPVWLAQPCAGHVLWAYNARHLDALEAYVAAGLRERRRDDAHGWRNAAWTSRLPTWIGAAKHREAVLRAIARLRRETLGAG